MILISNPLNILSATSSKADFDHGKNQSIVHPEINPGNFLALILNLSPTGEKHNITCKLFLAR